MILSNYVQVWLLGVTIHLSLFIRCEWHLLAPLVIILHVLVGLALLAVYASIHDKLAFLNFTVRAGTLSFVYLLGLFGSIAAYRIFFHRLRKFPGPHAAALTKLWHVYGCRNSRGYRQLHALQHEYGRFVRTGKKP